MAWTRGSIDGGETVNHTEDGDIHITGKIDGHSQATLVSTNGSIIIDGKIDNNCKVDLTAAQVIRIGAAAQDDGEKKIDNNSTVTAHAGFDVSVGHKIDNNCVVTLTSDLGSITIGGKIDQNSRVTLKAAGNIRIGEAGNDGAERKIDGSSRVDAVAGGTIHLYNKIDGSSVVDFRACRGIAIDDKIDGGSRVRLAIKTGKSSIGDRVGGGGTTVLFWPPDSLKVENGIDSNGSATASNWSDPADWCHAGPAGYYWRNWMQSFGYVTGRRVYPRTVQEIAKAIKDATLPAAVAIGLPIKAVGGGWSATDASLPFKTKAEIDAISILRRGADGQEDFSHVLQGLGPVTNSPVDLHPEDVEGDLSVSSHYDQSALTQLADSGANLPFNDHGVLIDTRGLASSLMAQLPSILGDEALKATTATGGAPPARYYFHVEAGITMMDLDQLLDHQSPRLAVLASGGSVGATLAGALATATHGAEFKDALLVDCVRAVHFVGPGGQEWWIEGDTPIADLQRLKKVYSGIDKDHFIAGSWTQDGLIAQDVLNAVVVSMGTMGVIYSMVLEVRPQFGIRQVVTAIPGPPLP